MTKRRFYCFLVLICIAAFASRILFIIDIRDAYQNTSSDPWLQGHPDGMEHKYDFRYYRSRGDLMQPGFDMGKYTRLARMVLKGDWLNEDATVTPLFALTIYPFFLYLSGNSIFHAMFFQAFMGTVSVWLIACIARRYLTHQGSLFTALVMAVYAPFIIYDGIPLTETSINFFFLASFLSFLWLREAPSISRALLLGMCVGFSIAAKPTMSVLIVLFPFASVLELGWKNVYPLFKWLVISLLPVIIVISPFIWRARVLSGEWLFLRGNINYMVWMGNNPKADGRFTYPSKEDMESFEIEAGNNIKKRDEIARKRVIHFWHEHPYAAIKVTLRKVLLILSPVEIKNNIDIEVYRKISLLQLPPFVTNRLLWPLAFVGLILLVRKWRRWAIPISFYVSYSALLIISIIISRYRFPVIICLILFAAKALEWLYNDGVYRDKIRFGVVGLIIVSMVFIQMFIFGYGMDFWRTMSI